LCAHLVETASTITPSFGIAHQYCGFLPLILLEQLATTLAPGARQPADGTSPGGHILVFPYPYMLAVSPIGRALLQHW